MPKTFILAIAVAALGSSTVATAQSAPGPKPVARADLIKALNSNFAAADTNHDGRVTPEEYRAARQEILERD